MLYFLLKIIFKLALKVFFRRIEVRNRHFIPENGAVLLAANHPNTFMDPIAIAAIIKQEVFFIAKGTVFNTPLKMWLLQKMNMIPVYRREDGALPATGNDGTFRKCIEFLQQNKTLLIFPEGNSYNERHLRPIKTGTARIALAAATQANTNTDLLIVPVGVNYTHPTRFRGNLFLNVGKPIVVKDFIAGPEIDPFQIAQNLTAELRNRLAELVIHTETEEEDELVEQVERVYLADLRKELGLPNRQADKFILTKSISESVRYFQKQQPDRVQVLRHKLNQYQQNLKKVGLQDHYLVQSQNNANLIKDSFKTLFYLIVGFPLVIWGLLTNYLPYYIPGKIADALTDEEEFRAPIMMTVGIFSFGLLYALEITAVYALTDSVPLALAFFLTLPVSGFFALSYSYRLRATQTYLRLFSFVYKSSSALSELIQQRKEIIESLEEAKKIYVQHTGLRPDKSPVKPK